MFKTWFSKEKKIKKKISMLYDKAVFEQRNGRLRNYGEVMAEIARLEEELSADKGKEGGGK